jgi:hypothetical protein
MGDEMGFLGFGELGLFTARPLACEESRQVAGQAQLRKRAGTGEQKTSVSRESLYQYLKTSS